MNRYTPGISIFMQHMVIECAALIAPCSAREEWLSKWNSELWYVRREAPGSKDVWGFCLGAFRDALWMRSYSPKESVRWRLESPLSCALFLFSAAFVSLLTALLLPGARNILLLSLHTESSCYWLHSWLGVSEFPPNPIDQQIVIFRQAFIYACSILPAVTTLDLRSRSPLKSLRSCLIRGRWFAFFLLKVILILPVVYLAELDLGDLFAPSGSLFIQMMTSIVGFLLLLRWALNDQRKRCRTCLHIVVNPVHVGQPSRVLLDWNLTEYICRQGHGVLQIPEASIDGFPAQQWLPLASS